MWNFLNFKKSAIIGMYLSFESLGIYANIGAYKIVII